VALNTIKQTNRLIGMINSVVGP